MGTVERGYAGPSLWDWSQAAGADRPALPRLRPRQRVDRHQRHRAHQRQRQRAVLTRPTWRRRRARRRAPPLRHPRLPDRALQRPGRDRRPADRRPARPACSVVARKADEIYRLHPRLRRLPRQGQLRGAARPAGLRRTHADGANVLADALAPHGGVVMWRAFVYSATWSPWTGPSRRTTSSCRSTAVPRQRVVQVKNGPHRLPAARALPPAVRRHAADAADARAPDHAGVPRALDAPRLPRAALRGGARRRHPRQGPGSTVAKVVDGGPARLRL
jgi:alpha-glucuronidase